MKKNLIVLSLIFIAFKLFSLEIINGDARKNITVNQLKNHKMIQFHTERTKNGKFKSEDWKGVQLSTILKENGITDYKMIKFTSADNYLVRLSKAQISKHKPIIALYKNGKELSAEKIRLIGKTLRDMFWIQGISIIETENGFENKFPHTIFMAENILKNQTMRTELPPFTPAKGYFFFDLVSKIFPIEHQDFLLVGRDGISHRLNFDKYLSKAALVYDDGNYSLKSPQMPAGMWIKNLSFIQTEGKGIAFVRQFKNPLELAELLKLKLKTNKLTVKSDSGVKKVSAETPFSDKQWENAVKFVW